MFFLFLSITPKRAVLELNEMMNYCLNIKGEAYRITQPVVMGILNCTPDSFYDGSRKQSEAEIADRANEIIAQGGTMIDVGAMSTRPGGDDVSEAEEMRRLRHALPIIRREQPDAILSVDTFRPNVARMAVEEYGVDIINDVGQPVRDIDSGVQAASLLPMMTEAARLQVPYILMSRDGNIDDMCRFFDSNIAASPTSNIILDPGYGFGKDISENYAILRQQESLLRYGMPILVGISRKRMIWQVLGTSAQEALNGTTILNTIALQRGAAILRVHDVKEAVEVVKLSPLAPEGGSNSRKTS